MPTGLGIGLSLGEFGGKVGGVPSARPGAVFQWFSYPQFSASDASHLVQCVNGASVQWIKDLVSGTWFQQSTGANQPVFDLTGGIYSTVFGASANQCLYVPAATLTIASPYTIVASIKNTGTTVQNGVVVDSDTTNQAALSIGEAGTDNPTIIQASNAATILKQAGQSCTSRSVVTLVVNGASSVLRTNGVETTGSQGGNSLTGVRIGNLRSSVPGGNPLAGGYVFKGNIQAIGVYNSALNATQRANEEAYFNYFWRAF